MQQRPDDRLARVAVRLIAFRVIRIMECSRAPVHGLPHLQPGRDPSAPVLHRGAMIVGRMSVTSGYDPRHIRRNNVAPRRRARGGRRAGVLAALAVLSGIAASSGVMWQASSAAFTGTTSNGANSWAAGTVSLTDDDSNGLLFSATNLKPGSTGVKCITVTYGGSSAAAVKLYGSAVTGTLGQYLNMVIEEGDGGTFADCTGFASPSTVYSGTLSNFGTTRTGFASGVGAFAPTAATQKKTYRFTYTVDPATPNAAQGTSANATFVWEAN